MNFDDFEKWRKEFERMMRGPLDELRRHQKMYEDMLRPLSLRDELLEPLQREFERHRGQQKWLEDQLTPILNNVNTWKNVTAPLGVRPSRNIWEDQERTLRSLYAPPDLSAMVDSIARDYERSIRMPRDVDRLLGDVGRYASASPAEPDAEILDAVREHVVELRNSQRERISDRFRQLLRWLVANAPRLDRNTVSFILFTVVYPLALGIYDDKIRDALRPDAKHEQKVLERRVVRAVTERIPASALSDLRYVSAQALCVRTAPRRNSGRVSTLAFGDVVIALTSKKDWTYVSYRVAEAEVRGWVYSRYLKRFPPTR